MQISNDTKIIFQGSFLLLWYLAWASIPHAFSGVPSAGTKAPVCCTTTWATGTCTSAWPSSSRSWRSSSTQPPGNACAETSRNTLKTMRDTLRPQKCSRPAWIWTVSERTAVRAKSTGLNLYIAWRITSGVKTWSPFYSGFMLIQASFYWRIVSYSRMCETVVVLYCKLIQTLLLGPSCFYKYFQRCFSSASKMF